MMTTYRCVYCNRSYSRESWWRKHVCEKRKRFEQAHNMDFVRGLRLYEHWWRRNGYPLRRNEHISDDRFIKSTLYKSFMKLVGFTNDNWVVTGVKYLDYLIDTGIPEPKWTSEETLKSYRDHLRRFEDPISQTKITCAAIQSYCQNNDMDVIEFFQKVTAGAALRMIANNQISPWVLFGYDRCVNELLARMNDDWLHSINEYINNTYWINKITASKETKAAIQMECEGVFGDA